MVLRSCIVLYHRYATNVTTHNRQVTLHWADNNDLFISRSRLHLGERAFWIAAPRAWKFLELLAI